MAKDHADASDRDPATDSGSNASTEAAASNLINAPKCANCEDADSSHIIWIDGTGYTPFCRVCAAAYELLHGDERQSETPHHADLTQTRAIAGFCAFCGPQPEKKTVRVLETRDAFRVECICGGYITVDPETTDEQADKATER